MESLNLLSCRMCLIVPGEETLTFSIFDTFKGRQLHEIVEQLFQIKVSKDDHLLNVCLECVNRVNTVQKIRQQFTKNDKKLRQLLEKFKDSQEIELLVIDDIELLDEVSLQKKSDVEIEVISIKAETEVSSTEGLNDSKEIPHEAQFEQQVDVVNSSGNIEQEQFEDEFTQSESQSTQKEKRSITSFRRKILRKEKSYQLPPKHKCYFCKTVFESDMAFTDHLHVHFEEMPFTCNKCDNIVIRSVRQASKHLALHDEEERPHKCPACELRFLTRENSLTHVRKIHRMKVKIQQNIDGYADRRKMKKYQCSFCGKLAPNSEYLRKHELTHGPTQPVHTCETCGKQFTARKNLTRHIMIHTGELPYKCHICDRAFRQAGDLKDHIRGHTKEKPYPCNLCDARFRNISMLHVHRKKNHAACIEKEKSKLNVSTR